MKCRYCFRCKRHHGMRSQLGRLFCWKKTPAGINRKPAKVR